MTRSLLLFVVLARRGDGRQSSTPAWAFSQESLECGKSHHSFQSDALHRNGALRTGSRRGVIRRLRPTSRIGSWDGAEIGRENAIKDLPINRICADGLLTSIQIE